MLNPEEYETSLWAMWSAGADTDLQLWNNRMLQMRGYMYALLDSGMILTEEYNNVAFLYQLADDAHSRILFETHKDEEK